MSEYRYTQEARAKAEKPLKGHKGRVHFGCRYSCECGWEGGTHWGKGAQGQAAADLYYHKLNCVVAAHEAAHG